MTTKENINLVLYNLSNMADDYEFIEDADLIFLNDYFRKSRPTFLLKETLESCEPLECDYSITNEILESLTNSVRKQTKKSRDAAKLSHVLKKAHFKAFFNCLKELNNEKHLPEEYDGDLFEIELGFPNKNDQVDGKQYISDSEGSEERSEFSEGSGESQESYESESIKDIKNLPTYQDIRYNDQKEYPSNSDFQIICIHRDPRQPLGITVVKTVIFYQGEMINKCVVERILVNSLIDKQGLLQVGDIIFEVNDHPVESPDDLLSMLSKYKGTITFKIIKSSKRPFANMGNLEKTFMRALFDYDPSQDKLLPAEQIGLPFRAGDVFEVLNRDDPNFWQATPLDSLDDQAFLIPSQSLQERIIALQKDVRPRSNENIAGKMKRKKSKKNELFRAKDAADMVSDADLQTYEEVVKLPPSRVPCVLLIGPTGIGKKAIKHFLVQKEPNRFAFPIQDASEIKKNRNQPLFNHVDKNVMVSDIKSSLYVCIEERSGELYGIKSAGIRALINQGKTVVLECQPKDVYHLKLPAFNPYVILIAAPSLTNLEAMQKEGLQKNLTKNKRSTSELEAIIQQSYYLENMYKHIINAVVVNENIQETASNISSLISEFESQDSWIPASWEFDITPLPLNKSGAHKSSIKPNNDIAPPTTGQRRYEKKTVSHPSISLSSNRVSVSKQSEDSLSEMESDSNSEGDVVMAKPIKYITPKNPENNEKMNEVRVPVQLAKQTSQQNDNPKSTSLTKQQSQQNDNYKSVPLTKQQSQQNDNSKSVPLTKQQSQQNDNSKSVPLAKQQSQQNDNSKSVPLTKQQSQQNDNPKSMPMTKQQKDPNVPTITPRPKQDNRNIPSANLSAKVNTPEIRQESIIKTKPPPVLQKPNVANDKPAQKNDRRLKIVKKESSSEISDTSSESELAMRENRV